MGYMGAIIPPDVRLAGSPAVTGIANANPREESSPPPDLLAGSVPPTK